MGRSVCIVGLGGAGCNVLSLLADRLTAGPSLAAVNTDAESLSKSRAATRLQIGEVRTNGLGCGGDPALGRSCAEDDRDLIRGVFSNADVAFVVAGFGGGTASGAAPVVLEEARNAGVLSICFAIVPGSFEGKQRRAQADHAISIARQNADAMIIVHNDRLMQTAGKTSMSEVFVGANETLASSLAALWNMIAKPGFISLDFADLKAMIENSGGACTLGHGEGKGRTRVEKALEALMKSPMVKQGEVISNAPALLVSIVGGPDLAVKNVGDIMESIEGAARNDCKVFMGTVVDDEWRGRIGLTLIASERWEAELQTGDGNLLSRQAEEPKRKTPTQGAGRGVQTKLPLDAAAKSRFKGVEPTVLNGEDLDTPTFIRRGIAIDK